MRLLALAIFVALCCPPAPAQNLRGELTVPVETEPTAATLDTSEGQRWHRLTFRLNGSMCPACLMQLESKLRTVSGVVYSKVNRDSGRGGPPGPPEDTTKPKHTTATAVVIYNDQSFKLDKLQSTVKSEKYKATEFHDAALLQTTTATQN